MTVPARESVAILGGTGALGRGLAALGGLALRDVDRNRAALPEVVLS